VKLGRKEKDREGKTRADLRRWPCPAAALPYNRYIGSGMYCCTTMSESWRREGKEKGRPGKMGLPSSSSAMTQPTDHTSMAAV